MVFDSIANNASILSAPSSKDSGKKKRGNRTAKLKQCKLDARREQWLSQGSVKNKGCKEEKNGIPDVKGNERDRTLENLEMRGRGKGNEGLIHHDSDLESLSNSPTSPLNGGVLGGNDLRTNYGGSGSSSSSGGSCSGSITEEEEEGDGGCLDDWEAVADALAANDKQEKPESPAQNENTAQLESHCESANGSDSAVQNAKSELPRMVSRVPVNSRAWRPDDAFRPQSLPNLSKQRSMPNSERQYGCGGVPWAYESVRSLPSSCPICYEDLDLTDSSFLPCSCGFHLCLFCHKRILEEDGRCPGCRKPYKHDPVEVDASVHSGSLTFRLARSCSMITRS